MNAGAILGSLQKETPNLTDFVADEAAFRTSYKGIIEEVQRKIPQYNSELVKNIMNIILNKNSKPPAKFNSLLLLLRASETRDKIIVSNLVKRQDFLSHILNIATFDTTSSSTTRGSYYFSKSPNNSELNYGKRIVRLAGECIIYWDLQFGSQDLTNPFQIFSLNYSTMRKRGIDYKEFQYAKGVPNLRSNSRSKSPTTIENSLPRRLQKVIEADPEKERSNTPEERKAKTRSKTVTFAYKSPEQEEPKGVKNDGEESDAQFKRLQEKELKPMGTREWLEFWKKDREEQTEEDQELGKSSIEYGTLHELPMLSTPSLRTYGSNAWTLPA